MRVLIAPDSFGGTLTAAEAADAMAVGWRRGAPATDLATLALSDGGPGFVDVITAGLAERWNSHTLVVSVPGPLGETVPATILMHEATAYIESAQSCGVHLIRLDDRDPLAATSFGLGEVIDHARSAGAERIVVGLGGTGTIDGGAGMLAGLGAQARAADGRDATHRLRAGPSGLADVTWVDCTPALHACAGIDLVAAVDVDVPLTGPHGAARGFAAQKFPDPAAVTPADLEGLDRTLAGFADLVRGQLDTTDLTMHSGAGAAGGIGWALLTLGAIIAPGIDVVAAAVGLEDELDGVDLVITGEGRLDWQTRHGKVVAGVAARASARGIPVVAIAGRVDLGDRECGALGIVEAWSLAGQPGGLARSMITPHQALADLSARVASQWTAA